MEKTFGLKVTVKVGPFKTANNAKQAASRLNKRFKLPVSTPKKLSMGYFYNYSIKYVGIESITKRNAIEKKLLEYKNINKIPMSITKL